MSIKLTYALVAGYKHWLPACVHARAAGRAVRNGLVYLLEFWTMLDDGIDGGTPGPQRDAGATARPGLMMPRWVSR